MACYGLPCDLFLNNPNYNPSTANPILRNQPAYQILLPTSEDPDSINVAPPAFPLSDNDESSCQTEVDQESSMLAACALRQGGGDPDQREEEEEEIEAVKKKTFWSYLAV